MHKYGRVSARIFAIVTYFKEIQIMSGYMMCRTWVAIRRKFAFSMQIRDCIFKCRPIYNIAFIMQFVRFDHFAVSVHVSEFVAFCDIKMSA